MKHDGKLHKFYHNYINIKLLIITALAVLLFICAIYAVSVGTVSIPMRDLILILMGQLDAEMTHYIIFEVRLPRIFIAIIAGMALACTGVIMQGLLRNPLASPFTLGVSSGAAFGAALAIVLGNRIFGANFIHSGRWMIVLHAFVFGCLSVLLVVGIARLKNSSTTVLLLAGVAIGQLFSAGVSALKYFSSNEALKDLVVWLMGGFWGVSWDVIQILFPLLAMSLVILMKYAWDLNALSAGDEVAKTLGVKVKRLRLLSLFLVTLVASATIAFTGIIGFIGLVAPHISRIFIGVDNRFLLPCSCFVGAILLLLSDTVARTMLSPVELPVGIITSLIGSPFFIYLLLKKRKDFWA